MTAYVPSRDEKDLTKLILSLMELASGRSNAVGILTLAAGTSATVILADNCAAGSTPILTPITADAAAEVSAGTMYISAVANKSFTIVHSNSANTGRTFRFAILG